MTRPASAAVGLPNGGQNYPVLDAVTSGWAGGPIAVRGHLHAAAGTSYAVEFYANPTADASGQHQLGPARFSSGPLPVAGGTHNRPCRSLRPTGAPM